MTSHVLRRLHSLAGIVPLGAFLAFHLYENSASLEGPQAYDAMAARIREMRFVTVLEVGVILLPLAFHAVYGLVLTAGSAVDRMETLGNARFLLQRASGLLLVVFVVFHLVTTRLQEWLDPPAYGGSMFRLVQEVVASPALAGLYVLGILAACFHLASGLWSAAIVWGVTVGPGAQRRMGYICAAVFAALAALGLGSLRGFLRAGG